MCGASRPHVTELSGALPFVVPLLASAANPDKANAPKRPGGEGHQRAPAIDEVPHGVLDCARADRCRVGLLPTVKQHAVNFPRRGFYMSRLQMMILAVSSG